MAPTIHHLLLSVAFDEIGEATDVAVREGLGIEVTYYDTAWLMGESALDEAHRAGESFAASDLLITAHGPLYDLNPGSLDPAIRAHTRACMLRGVAAAEAMRAGKIVFHTFYNPLLPDGVLPGWKELAVPIWRETEEAARESGIVLCLENSYEPSAEFFRDLYDVFLTNGSAVCFDPAHVHLYSRDGQASWVVRMGDRISHLHLNDNRGSSDDHLELGGGSIPYASFLAELCQACGSSTVVLEMNLERAVRSLDYLRRLGVWDG